MASPQQLSVKVRKFLGDRDNQFWLSQASIIEMTIKMNIGKLVYKGGLNTLLEDIDEAKFKILSIERNHLLKYEKLPLHHRDPFDRIIIAQAMFGDIAVISKDKSFNKYDIQVIW